MRARALSLQFLRPETLFCIATCTDIASNSISSSTGALFKTHSETHQRHGTGTITSACMFRERMHAARTRYHVAPLISSGTRRSSRWRNTPTNSPQGSSMQAKGHHAWRGARLGGHCHVEDRMGGHGGRASRLETRLRMCPLLTARRLRFCTCLRNINALCGGCLQRMSDEAVLSLSLCLSL